MKKRLLACAVLGGLSFAVTPVQAFDWNIANAHVVQMELTYLPNQIRFMIDAPAGSCAVGSALIWNGHGSDATSKAANVTAVYSALMTALRLAARSLSWEIMPIVQSISFILNDGHAHWTHGDLAQIVLTP